ncbi:uncharacterized protein LOC131072946 isoform X2 [Cryptomeria japonica]|uniref:uncharacterized protein LOC131072946 isoform X2 n=1 Tax=Cryptomeria japonica TaxID=3369 RepID=UPI0025ABA13C|nr:uncharacterized protein LOC131072946 isoform X2 [Cryptomeria japonica]
MACRFLARNGILQDMDIPSAPQFLISTNTGAYTTTRTGGQGSCVLLWERHLIRLSQSLKLLAEAKPQLYPALPFFVPTWYDDEIRPLVQLSLEAGLRKALQTTKNDEEMTITALVCGSSASVEGRANKPCDVYVHIASYIPSSIANGAAHLAIVGPGRKNASTKSSEWVRARECLERLRPPSVTELLLSDDGDSLLEGTITNFFAVCYQESKEKDEEDINEDSDSSKWTGYEIHTAPIIDGVLPGVIRQLVIEICADEGILLREVAPSWSNRQLWKEAFISNSVRLVQHVESIQAPYSWSQLLHAESWKDVSWKAIHLEGPGIVTQKIQKLVLEHAMSEGYQFRDVVK